MGDKLCALAEEDEARGPPDLGRRQIRPRRDLLSSPRALAGAWRAGPARALPALPRRLRARHRARRARTASGWRSPTRVSALSALYVRAEGVEGRAPLLVQVNGLDSHQGDEIPRRPAALARASAASPRCRRPTGHGRGAAAARPAPPSTIPSIWASRDRRLAGDARRRRRQAHRLRGRFARRLLLPARRRVRAALRLRRGLGRQSRLARRAEEAAAREGNFPVPHYWEHVRWVWGAKDMDEFMAHRRERASRRRARPHPRAVPRHARREGFADPAAMGAAHLRATGQQPEARTEDLHRARRRRAAFELRQFRQRRRLHRRLGRRDARRPHGDPHTERKQR